jgi:hypothetical protein
MYRLRVTTIIDDDEYGNGGSYTQEDRYYGPLSEILSRLCYPWLDGVAFAVYQKQSDESWLLYYHSI